MKGRLHANRKCSRQHSLKRGELEQSFKAFLHITHTEMLLPQTSQEMMRSSFMHDHLSVRSLKTMHRLICK